MQRQHIQFIIDQIAILAQKENTVSLARLLKEYGTLDICLDGLTAAAILAKKGDFQAVSFLYKNFLIDRDRVAYGLSLGGHFDLLKKIKYSADDAIKGAARGGYVDVMFAMIKEHHCGIDAVSEVARMGKFEIVEELMTLLSNPMPHHNGSGSSHYFYKDVIACAAYGAAIGGHFQAMQSYIKRVSSQDDSCKSALNAAVQGAAEGGHVAVVKELISQGANSSEAVSGAINGGHFDLANQLIQSIQDDNLVIEACCTAIHQGYFDFAKELIKNGSYEVLQRAFFASAKANHYEILNQLMKWKDLAESEYHQQDMRKRIPLFQKMSLLFISLIDEESLRYQCILGATEYADSYSSNYGRVKNHQKCSKYKNATTMMHYLISKYKLNFTAAYKEIQSLPLYHSTTSFFPGCNVKNATGQLYSYHDGELDVLYSAVFNLLTDGRLCFDLNSNFYYEKLFAPGKPEAGMLQEKLIYVLNLFGLQLDHDSNFNGELIFTKESSDKMIANKIVFAANKEEFTKFFAEEIESLQSFASILEHHKNAECRVSGVPDALFSVTKPATHETKINNIGDSSMQVDENQTTLSAALLKGFIF